jgi:uncharacterized protein
MSKTLNENQKKSKVEKIANNYASFASKYRYVLLILSILLTGLTFTYTKDNLKVNADLASLLPQNTLSIRALNESNKRFGATDKFFFGIEGKTPQEVHRLQQDVLAKVNKEWTDLMVSAQIDKDVRFFEDRALLYLPIKHLEHIRDNLDELKKRETNKSNPFLVDDFFDEDELDESEKEKEIVWFEASLPQELGLPYEAAKPFVKMFGGDKKDKISSAVSKKEKFDPKANMPDSLHHLLMGQSETGEFVGLVQLKLVKPSTDLDFTKIILERSKKLVSEVLTQPHAEGMYMAVEGTYEGLKDVKQLQNDGYISGLVSASLVLLLLLYFFRSIKLPILMMIQIIFACNLMLFFTAFVYGELNPFSIFVAAIVVGMGIDYSIHFLGSVQRKFSELKQGADSKEKTREIIVESISYALSHVMFPLVLAAVTTVAGLLTLLSAEFRGFFEFGVIASAGVVFSAISALFYLPVLILCSGGVPIKKEKSFFPKSWSDERLSKGLAKIAGVGLLISVILACFIPFAEFEHDFRRLRAIKPPKDTTVVQEHSIRTGVANTGQGKSSQPTVVFGDNLKEMYALHDTLIHRMTIEKDPYLQSFITLKTFLPDSLVQDGRLKYIAQIAERINDPAFENSTGENQKMVERLKKMVTQLPFGIKDIPEWATSMLKEKNGDIGNIAVIYGSYESWNAEDVGRFQDKYSHWNFGGDDLRAFSSSFIFSDVIRVVKEDAAAMSILIFGIIIFTLAFALRSVKLIILCSLPLALGMLWTAGSMGLETILINHGRLSIYNVIVVPVLLGVGIDAVIYLFTAWVRTPGQLKHIYDTTGKMVIASSLTTTAGFVGVFFVSHRGMRTIAELAVLGIICALVTALIFTPYFAKKMLGNGEVK